jgi:uncharacterized protein (TIGR03067 family)
MTMRSAAYTTIAFAGLLANCGSVGHGAPRLRSPDTSAELKLLQGKWHAVDCVWEGRLRIGRRLVKEKLQLRVTGRMWELSGGTRIEFETQRYLIDLDRTPSPHHLDLQWVNERGKPTQTILELPNEGSAAVVRERMVPARKGICECDGTSLKLVFGRPGDPRPMSLDGKKLEDGQTLIVLERPGE